MSQDSFLTGIDAIKCEADVQFFAKNKLESIDFGYIVHQHKVGIPKLDRAFPSKKRPGKTGGKPDLLLCCIGDDYPVCVWENKDPSVSALDALSEAKFYIEGLFKSLPNETALPRLAAGFNGIELCLSFFNTDNQWIAVKSKGVLIKDMFVPARLARNGINNKGEFLAINGWATEQDLRDLLPKLKTLYRYIPSLTHGRKPIDFTIALLTLRMLVERNKSWGSWTEQPSFSTGTATLDQSIRERFKVLLDRILSDSNLKFKYGQIFEFKESNDGDEIAFSFLKTIESIPVHSKASKTLKGGNFEQLFSLMDSMPPLEHADFDVFGEVYQHIGDNATKKALGQFFTGRHIISAFLPVLFVRSGIDQDEDRVKSITVCDPACGTGGFLTEFFRLIKKSFQLSPKELSDLSKHAFFGFDLSHSNSSRASVNMYFAGDGFSRIEGGRDSLESSFKNEFDSNFDFCVTNPPYGKSSYGRAEEAFLKRIIDILKPGGWALAVLPTGTLENPRSMSERFNLLKACIVTDSVTLPKHAFAPYTQQKTSILIFRKRKSALPVADSDTHGLIQAIKNEKINFFIVDNDGFANSDKRYPTDLKNDNGCWLHNDLSDWLDSNGVLQKSKVFQALVNGVTIDIHPTKEFGENAGSKFQSLSFEECYANNHHDLSLLADTYLRNKSEDIAMNEYLQRTNIVSDYVNGKNDCLSGNFLKELDELTSFPVNQPNGTWYVTCKLGDLFRINKGSQGLTEEIIYKNYDNAGIPVFGGGSKQTNFKIKKTTVSNKGKIVQLFSAPAIVISMDGSSGNVQVVRNGTFTANHHAAVLTPEDASLDLDWVSQSIELGLKKLASNTEGSATLTMTRLGLYEVNIPIPKKLRNIIGDNRRTLLSIKERFAN